MMDAAEMQGSIASPPTMARACQHHSARPGEVRLTLGDLQPFEHYDRVTAGMVVTGLDITGRALDQHVHMLCLIVPVEDLDLNSMSEGQHVDIVLPIDIPAMSDMKC